MKKILLCLFWCLVANANGSFGQEDYRPQVGKFPAIEKAKAYRGELVFVDHVNRRGSLRLHIDGHFQEGPLHHFAMLPYGVIRYRGAPADLRDIPIGTILYGKFYLPPDEKASVVPISKGNQITAPRENHAILLEDGPSLCLREKKSWTVQKLRIGNGVGEMTANISQKEKGVGLSGEHSLTIDRSTRFWRGRELLGMDELIKDRTFPANGEMNFDDLKVHLSLTWHPKYLYQKFHISDIWLDEPAMEVAREQQRQRHIRHIKTRWMPAVIDSVEHGEFGKATVMATLLGGMDETLYTDFKKDRGGKMAAAERTLRTWWPDHDGMDGQIIGTKTIAKDPPLGSSGIQIQFRVNLILEGFRPGRIVRIRPANWPNVKPPVEERVRGIDDRWPSTDVFNNR